MKNTERPFRLFYTGWKFVFFSQLSVKIPWKNRHQENWASPAFFWMLFTFVVELQWDLCIQANAKVVVHDTLLHVAFSAWRNSQRCKTVDRFTKFGEKSGCESWVWKAYFFGKENLWKIHSDENRVFCFLFLTCSCGIFLVIADI